MKVSLIQQTDSRGKTVGRKPELRAVRTYESPGVAREVDGSAWKLTDTVPNLESLI